MAESIGGGDLPVKVKQYYKISIDKTNLGRVTFKGPIKKISLSPESSDVPAENDALNNVSIRIKLSMKRYSPNNILIGSYSDSFYKKNLVKTVGIGSGISPSNIYPLDIAAGGNHLRMDKDGALSFGKVILNTDKPISEVGLGDETGIYIIHFTISGTQYTSILCRSTMSMGSLQYLGTSYATDSGGYSLLCTSMGTIKIYNGSDQQTSVTINKIIKIMSD